MGLTKAHKPRQESKQTPGLVISTIMNHKESSDDIKLNAIPKWKRRIHDDSNSNLDLADQLDSLQRAFANERGENEHFRQEVRTWVRLLLRGSY